MAQRDDTGLQACWWDGTLLQYVDQRRLPNELVVSTATGVDDVIEAIASSAVCGTRSISIFAGLGMALVRHTLSSSKDIAAAAERIRAALRIGSSALAVDRVADVDVDLAWSEAQKYQSEQHRVNAGIAETIRTLLPATGALLVHGETGALATGGGGTVIASIIDAHASGRALRVFTPEGRPHMTGARVTAFELRRAGVPLTVIGDSATAWILGTANITSIFVGATALFENGDVLAQVGTYGIALAAARHGIPLYIAAPRSSLGVAAHRSSLGVTAPRSSLGIAGGNSDLTPDPLDRTVDFVSDLRFDRTPGHLITGIVTEYGLSRPPFDDALATLMTRPTFALIEQR